MANTQLEFSDGRKVRKMDPVVNRFQKSTSPVIGATVFKPRFWKKEGDEWHNKFARSELTDLTNEVRMFCHLSTT